jgi:hypothetical protein
VSIVSRPFINTKRKDDSLASGQLIYRAYQSRKTEAKKTIKKAIKPASASVRVVHQLPSPKVTTVAKKVSWIRTPLMLSEKSRFLEMLFYPAPMLSKRAAYYGLWIIPIFLAGTVGVVLPFILWGK